MSRATKVVVVTGLSGAGKSTAIAALEDLGFHAVENLPPSVIEHAIDACEQAGVLDIALGFGADVGAFLDGAAEALSRLAATPGRRVTVMFLDASDEVLLRRFSETRRPHPLLTASKRPVGPGGAAVVLDGVRLERERLSPLRGMASVVLDTSGLRVHDLRKRVIGFFRGETAEELKMHARLLSFGFKYGLPSDADLVFDVRFLDNPHFVPELRPLTGEDERVRSYVLRSEGADTFVRMAVELLHFLLPRYEAEGKSYLTVGVGCTGGQHRSVSLAIAIAARLGELGHAGLKVVHRDVHGNVSAGEPVSRLPGG